MSLSKRQTDLVKLIVVAEQNSAEAVQEMKIFQAAISVKQKGPQTAVTASDIAGIRAEIDTRQQEIDTLEVKRVKAVLFLMNPKDDVLQTSGEKPLTDAGINLAKKEVKQLMQGEANTAAEMNRPASPSRSGSQESVFKRMLHSFSPKKSPSKSLDQETLLSQHSKSGGQLRDEKENTLNAAMSRPRSS